MNNTETTITSHLIYQSGDPRQGVVQIKAAYIEKEKALFKLSPRCLILGGLILILILFSPLLFMETKYHLSRLLENEVIAEESPGPTFTNVIREADLKILNPVDPDFSLVIPKIGVNEAIFPQVDPTQKEEYEEVLKRGIAQAAGSSFPGENGSLYLFGHSTDYLWNVSQFNAVFYLLKELEPGDQINIFYQGRRFVYQVTEKKTISSGDVYYIKPKTGKEEVILQTCWPPGTTWQRLLVFAEPIN